MRLAAYLAYLAAFATFAVAALWSAVPRMRRTAGGGMRMSAAELAGTLVQLGGALLLTMTMREGPLGAGKWELLGALAAAPAGAALFVWALLSAPAGAQALAMGGAYAWLRHPIYLAFLLMLVATGFLVAAGAKLLAAVALYAAGTELRMRSEEAELARRYGEEWCKYARRTRWRYVPGLK